MQNSGLQIKKLLLGIAVLAVFIVYSFAARHSDANNIIAPSSQKSGSSSGNDAGSGTSSASNSSGNSSPSSGGSSSSSASSYKDGTYTGSAANAYYGNVQVQATIKNGKITDVEFLEYPNDNPNSQNINSQAMPYLKQEAIQAQSSQVDIVSGATLTSQAFAQSLQSALSQA